MGKRILDFLLRRRTILVAFVIATVVSAVANDSGRGWIPVALAVTVFPLLAWFTYKRQLLATWATVIVLILSGSGYIYDSLLGLKGGEGGYAVALLRILAGIYLTWGALILHRERHAGD